MPSWNLDFKVISGVIKVNEVIIGKIGVYMWSEEHNFGKLIKHHQIFVFISLHYSVVIWDI